MRTAYYRILLYIDSCTEHDVYYETANNMLEILEKVPNSSIQEVAKLCYVSPSTISRFCRKISFDSYNDFKTAVIESLEYFERDFDYYFPNVDSSDHVLEKHHLSIIDAINTTNELVSLGQIQQFAKLIHDSKRIIFLGNYFSQNTVLQFQMELAHFHKVTCAFYSINDQLDAVKDSNEDDLLIITSTTGQYLENTNEVMRQFKHSNAKKVIVNAGKQPNYLKDIDLYISISKDLESGNKFSIIYLYELIELIYHFTYFRHE